MKNIFLLSIVLVFALFATTSNAQWRLGVQAGLNLTDVSIDTSEEGFKTAMRTRAILGGIVTYDFSPVLSLQFEPAYVQKGATADFSVIEEDISVDVEADISADFLEFPVLLKATLPYGPLKPYLLAGGSVAFLMGDAKLKVEKATINGQDVINMIPVDEREQKLEIKSTDLILSLGAGITIPVSLLDLFIEGRYDLGLTELNDDPDDDASIKTTGFQIKAGILFAL